MIKKLFSLSGRPARQDDKRPAAVFTRATQPARHDPKSPQELLANIQHVGQSKLMGYLPISTITELCAEDPLALREEAEGKGLKALLLNGSACSVYSGALFVYDEERLRDFLHMPDNKRILRRYDWPLEPEDFVLHVSRVIADSKTKTPLYDLIALAYNDPRPFYQTYQTPLLGPVPYKFR